MGGCASRTKELDGQDINNLPAEKPASLEVTADAPTEVNNEVVENQNDKEEPLVDLSSPAPNVPSDVANEATGIEELKLDAPQNTSTDSGDANDTEKETAEPNVENIADDTTETDKIEKNAEGAADQVEETAAETETTKVDVEAEKAD